MQNNSKITIQYWEQITKGINSKNMLTDTDIIKIERKLANKKGMSFFIKNGRNIVFTEIVKKVDRYIYMILPQKLYSSIKNPSSGLSHKEVKTLKKN